MAAVKITQITKDFALKTKDVLELLKTHGVEKKSGATLSEAEFALFLNAVTAANQIENLDDYLSGRARILTSAPAETPIVAEEPAVTEVATPTVTPVATEAPAEEKKVEEKKVEEKKADDKSAGNAQLIALRTPGVWILALASAFMYISRYSLNSWGILFLQEEKGFSLESATFIISIKT